MGKVSKRTYCQFCGGVISSMAIIDGLYSEQVCTNPSCCAHGDELEAEILDYEDAYIRLLDGDNDD